MLNIEISAVDSKSTTMGKPPWLVDYKGEDWIRVNYDTGASTTAFPGSVAEGVPLTKVGKYFVVASGARSPTMAG